MDYIEQIHNYMKTHGDEAVKLLKELVKIPSVRGEAESGAPFGKYCAEALNYTRELYSENGFETELDSEGGYLLSFYGSGKHTLGLFAHTDAVAADDGWVHTKPFEPVIRDGCLVGRGALDDKSAIVISLYCAKMLKELSLPFNSRLVMFTGSGEETGMTDINNYLSRHTAPNFSLVCDTAFPIYIGDKSGMNCRITFNTALKDIGNFYGGRAMNITLGEASAEVNGEALTEKGISRHSALPEGSVNAAYCLAEALLRRDGICASDKKQLRLISLISEKYYGEVFGIEHSDECGRLTCTVCTAETENGKITLGLNLRFGLSADSEYIRQRISDFCRENNACAEFEEEKRGYLASRENKYIKACLKAYSDFTGDKSPSTYINAGGTYARKLPCAAEIGTALGWSTPKNTPPGHGGAHQPDECIDISGFIAACELTICMLLEADKVI